MRKLAIAAMTGLLSSRKASVHRRVLMQVDSFFHAHEAVGSQFSLGTLKQTNGGRKQQADRSTLIQRGLKDLVEAVICTLQKEGKHHLK